MKIETTKLQDALIITPRRFGDARGWFMESWNRMTLSEAGFDLEFVQDNHSFSADVGTLRGMHFQALPRSQEKLVRCSRGIIYDVIVDVRVGSPSYGQWIAVELSAENGKQLLVPKGFLHGFVTRTPNTEVQYKVTDFYVPECDGAVRWDSLGIDWKLEVPPILSKKDAAAPSFTQWKSPFTFKGAS
ncbi:dTDP-4-dehydrorhamnose 3,5-epimerase [Pseudophaeobacter sp. TrK17]|uniref:dTDP-4-dehydrorhamnose 3,5-epimerase n=1 Tax=Pseudophaeobacter sp. TrK17 TaxID=2815167 RepID=UPI0035D09B09